jgi:2-polyprenyl-3-methyl-5-hydroxy-6-metoxy-1,4-benzoquinol methylase
MAQQRSAETTPGCWACGSQTAPSTRLAGLAFAACPACGLQQRHDQVAAAVQTHYAGGGYEDDRSQTYASVGELEDRRRDARVRLTFIRAYAPRGRLLDVGAAGGAFVVEAQAAGYAAAGIEPAPAFAAFAREQLGVDVRTATIEDCHLEPARLDVVCMWHVLEHLHEPAATLRRVRAALRPNGHLAIEVPNAGSTIARAMGPSWPMLEPDVHVAQYTATALAAVIRSAGLEIVDISATTIAPYLRPLRRLHPATVIHRAKWAVRGRRDDPRDRGELLRAIARRPDEARLGA